MENETRLAVEKHTQRKVALLAKVMNVTIYNLVETWAAQEWKAAKKAGLVTDAMLASTGTKAES